jgi:hypothetical protein
MLVATAPGTTTDPDMIARWEVPVVLPAPASVGWVGQNVP